MEKVLPVLTAKIITDAHRVNFISLVDEPAIEIDSVALAKSMEEYVCMQVEDKQILAGPILVPNKKIYRNIDGYECYWVFPEDVVRQIAELFNSDGNQQNINLMHQPDSKVSGAFLSENWIIDYPEHDKSNAYGFCLPRSTWFGLTKFTNKNFWQSEVKTGRVKGYSIEGVMAFVEMNKIKMNKNMDYGKFKLEKDATLEDGTKIYTTAAEFEVGAPLFVVDENGQQFAAKDGDYVIPSYGIVSVKDGMITELVKEEVKPVEQVEEVKPVENAPVEQVEAPAPEVKAALTPEDIAAVMSQIQPMIDEVAARISNLEQQVNELVGGMGAIEEMKTEKETLRTELAAIKDSLPSLSVAKPEEKKVRLATEPVEKKPLDQTAKAVFELAERMANK